VVSAIERETGTSLPVETAERRPGDLGLVVAKTDKLSQVLGWKPQYADLATIVRTALNWERKIRTAS
jgi:UDP-glucose 4-epimerase